jgi:TIR domain
MVVQALDCFFPLDERLVERRKYMDDLRDTGLLLDEFVTLTHRPKVFLSYGHEDRELVQHLRTECLRHGVHAWMDSEQIRVGDLWEERIKRAISEAAAVVLCFSETNSPGRVFQSSRGNARS